MGLNRSSPCTVTGSLLSLRRQGKKSLPICEFSPVQHTTETFRRQQVVVHAGALPYNYSCRYSCRCSTVRYSCRYSCRCSTVKHSCRHSRRCSTVEYSCTYLCRCLTVRILLCVISPPLCINNPTRVHIQHLDLVITYRKPW